MVAHCWLARAQACSSGKTAAVVTLTSVSHSSRVLCSGGGHGSLITCNTTGAVAQQGVRVCRQRAYNQPLRTYYGINVCACVSASNSQPPSCRVLSSPCPDGYQAHSSLAWPS